MGALEILFIIIIWKEPINMAGLGHEELKSEAERYLGSLARTVVQ